MIEETAINYIRKKDIDDDLFFSPDLSLLPIREYSQHEKTKFPVLAARQDKVISAAREKMIRFNEPTTNRDIKLKYGTLNLETIACYEENYTRYMYALLNWSESLIDTANLAEAETALLGSISQGSEFSKSYTLLADIYYRRSDKRKMQDLYDTVNALDIPGQKKAWLHINEYLLKM